MVSPFFEWVRGLEDLREPPTLSSQCAGAVVLGRPCKHKIRLLSLCVEYHASSVRIFREVLASRRAPAWRWIRLSRHWLLGGPNRLRLLLEVLNSPQHFGKLLLLFELSRGYFAEDDRLEYETDRCRPTKHERTEKRSSRERVTPDPWLGRAHR